MEKHNNNLNYLCRICSKWVGRRQYIMNDTLKIKIENIFLIKIADIENVHPKKMCHKCYCTINNANSSKTKTSLAIFVNWLPHEKICITCQMAEEVQKGQLVHV